LELHRQDVEVDAMDPEYLQMVDSGAITVLLLFLPHILLAAWALSRLQKRARSDEARALWTALIIVLPLVGPLLYLLGSRWQPREVG
jgi:cytochrome bd-type quinol oxidase subunit 2